MEDFPCFTLDVVSVWRSSMSLRRKGYTDAAPLFRGRFYSLSRRRLWCRCTRHLAAFRTLTEVLKLGATQGLRTYLIFPSWSRIAVSAGFRAVGFGDGTVSALFRWTDTHSRDGAVCCSRIFTCHTFLWFVGEPAVDFLKVVLGHGLEHVFQSTIYILIDFKSNQPPSLRRGYPGTSLRATGVFRFCAEPSMSVATSIGS